MNKKNRAVWTGWQGKGRPPGADWLPGPGLRFAILSLTYAFLALSLTVNFAYSTAFFLLAIAGTYVGFRRGFINGISRRERFVMATFAIVLAIAIASYAIGLQTVTGFHILGRDLRFLLFIPVYLAIRWVRPRRAHVALALAGSAIGACIMASLTHGSWPRPQGATGTHIVFGDLALLSGCLGAALLWPQGNAKTATVVRYGRGAVALVAAGTGIVASVLADAAGSWLALPVVACMFALLAPLGGSSKKALRFGFTALLLVIVAAAAWFVPPVRGRIILTERHLAAYREAANPSAIDARCLDHKDLLEILLQASYTRGHGQVGIVKLDEGDRNEISKFGCDGDYALALKTPASNRRAAQIGLYRGRGRAHNSSQSATILARGEAKFNVGWKDAWLNIRNPGRWHEYTAQGRDPHIRSAIIVVSPGHRILIVPIQEQRGEFIYPLVASSVSSRIEMWLAAWRQFLANPWIGTGTGAYRAVHERHGDLRIAGNYEHAHSDYFTNLATKGIVGFLALILLFAAVPIAAWSHPKCTTREQQDRIFFVAMIFSAAFAVFSLTETMFIHSQVISWYGVVAAAILSLSKQDVGAAVVLPASDSA